MSVYGVGVDRRTENRGGGNGKKKVHEERKRSKDETRNSVKKGRRKGGEENTGERQKGKVERVKDVDKEQGRGKGRRPQGKKAASQGQRSDAGGGEGSL